MPKKDPVPNSFNYFPRVTLKVAAGKCPAAGVPSDYLDSQRELFLLHGNEISLYHTETEQFSDSAIKEIKTQTMQVYLDISSSRKSLDIRKDMKKLNILHQCKMCSKIVVCPAVFEPDGKDVYENMEERIKDILKSLKGNLLDVGCGRILYKDMLQDLVRKNQIQYVGVDPNPASSNGFKIYRSAIEDFQWQEDYFDAVIILRSYNHFFDLKKAFNVIYRVLKLGGEILIVDDGPYALLRKKEITKSDYTLKYEHYRNHTSYDALNFISAHYMDKFMLKKHQPLVSYMGNQWLLSFLKK
jgi:SAM-dependent methyltransferase